MFKRQIHNLATCNFATVKPWAKIIGHKTLLQKYTNKKVVCEKRPGLLRKLGKEAVSSGKGNELDTIKLKEHKRKSEQYETDFLFTGKKTKSLNKKLAPRTQCAQSSVYPRGNVHAWFIPAWQHSFSATGKGTHHAKKMQGGNKCHPHAPFKPNNFMEQTQLK